MTEKNEKINGVITYHKKTKGGMAVFYPKHDITRSVLLLVTLFVMQQ
jgi:hypothetical protein